MTSARCALLLVATVIIPTLFGRAQPAAAQVCGYGSEGTTWPPADDGVTLPNGYCRALRCRDDSDCRASMECKPSRLCIATMTVPNNPRVQVETAWSPCDARGGCQEAHARCESGTYCMPTTTRAAPPTVRAARTPRSTDLRALIASTRTTVAALDRSARARRRTLGRSPVKTLRYDVRSFGGAGESLRDSAFAMCRVLYHPDADDEAWYERTSYVGNPVVAEELVTVFEAHRQEINPSPRVCPGNDGECRLRARLVAEIAEWRATHPHAQIITLHCGWGDVDGGSRSSVVAFDPATREMVCLSYEEIWSADA